MKRKLNINALVVAIHEDVSKHGTGLHFEVNVTKWKEIARRDVVYTVFLEAAHDGLLLSLEHFSNLEEAKAFAESAFDVIDNHFERVRFTDWNVTFSLAENVENL